MASVQNIGINGEKIKGNNEQTQHSTEMAKEVSSTPIGKTPTRESSYWFAHSGHEDVPPNSTQPDPKAGGDSAKDVQRDKDEKLRRLRNLELQEEERLRKIRELEHQFSAAKKHREQQEEERRRRIEEARVKEAERRQQVEERKRQIWEAEQERKEAILRRNMEREARIEARRNAQRNSQCFAFGSSTPRSFDLDLAAIGVRNQGSVLMCSVSRRSEERELGPPRATSACSLDRKFGEDCMSRSMVSLSSSTFRGRKRTDIMPTMTRERSITPHSNPRGKDTSRSLSRPQSALSGTSDISATSSSVSAVHMRPRVAPRKPRPFSVAGSIVDSSSLTQSLRKEPERQPRLHERNVSAPAAKPQRAKSANRESSEFKNTRVSAPKKPVLPPKPTELLAKTKSHPVPIKDNLRKMAKPTKPTSIEIKPASGIHHNGIEKAECKLKDTNQTEQNSAPNPSSIVTSPTSDSDVPLSFDGSKANVALESEGSLSHSITESEPKVGISTETKSPAVKTVEQNIPMDAQSKEGSLSSDSLELNDTLEDSPKASMFSKDAIPALMTTSLVIKSDVKKEDIPSLMTTSLVMENGIKEFTPLKPRITSEEEARAALAEKRRLAREQAEREAELERQRLEEIRRQEEEQQRLEELEQKRMEEEQIRLAELHRQLEQEKLSKAIEEQQQREKEEQERRDEEARQKAEREEQEKKAREEAEKQKIELEEKLRKEEEARAERKRRVEEIMARTRGKSAAQSPSTPQAAESNKSIKAEESFNTTPSPVEPPKLDLPPSDETSNHVSNGVKEHTVEKTSVNGTSSGNHVTNSWAFSEEKQNASPLPDILNSTHHNGSFAGTEEQVSKVSVSSSFSMTSSRTLSANEDVSPQTNGYSSHEEMSCTTSPEENTDMELLIDVQNSQHRSSKSFSEPVDYNKLVEVEPPSLDNVNYLINVDDVNSNLFNSANPFVKYEDSLQQKQDTPVTDLLS